MYLSWPPLCIIIMIHTMYVYFVLCSPNLLETCYITLGWILLASTNVSDFTNTSTYLAQVNISDSSKIKVYSCTVDLLLCILNSLYS